MRSAFSIRNPCKLSYEMSCFDWTNFAGSVTWIEFSDHEHACPCFRSYESTLHTQAKRMMAVENLGLDEIEEDESSSI